MRRAAVFAHYDKDRIIDDYVIYYLKSLKEIFDNIVLFPVWKFQRRKLQSLMV